MKIQAPQVIYFLLIGIILLAHALRDGEYKDNQKYDFKFQLLTEMGMFLLLYWGGFFT